MSLLLPYVSTMFMSLRSVLSAIKFQCTRPDALLPSVFHHRIK